MTRAALGPHDLLTIPEVVRQLGIRRCDAVRWLHKHCLIRTVLGRQRVIWGDVLQAIRQESPSSVDRAEEAPKPRQPPARAVLRLPLSKSL